MQSRKQFNTPRLFFNDELENCVFICNTNSFTMGKILVMNLVNTAPMTKTSL